MSWHMSPPYGHGILVSDYPVLTAVNWPYWEFPILKSYIKDVDLPRHAWDTPPFLFKVSPTPPIQSVDAYVRMYVRTYVRTYVRSVNHVTTKRKEVDHIPWVWGSVPRALRARGSPAINLEIPANSSWPVIKTGAHHYGINFNCLSANKIIPSEWLRRVFRKTNVIDSTDIFIV